MQGAFGSSKQGSTTVGSVNERKLTLWIKSGDTCELLVDLKRSGDLFYLTRAQFDIIRKAMFSQRETPISS
eukprot:7415127-Prorocentrum_lima.AAC.1